MTIGCMTKSKLAKKCQEEFPNRITSITEYKTKDTTVFNLYKIDTTIAQVDTTICPPDTTQRIKIKEIKTKCPKTEVQIQTRTIETTKEIKTLDSVYMYQVFLQLDSLKKENTRLTVANKSKNKLLFILMVIIGALTGYFVYNFKKNN